MDTSEKMNQKALKRFIQCSRLLTWHILIPSIHILITGKICHVQYLHIFRFSLTASGKEGTLERSVGTRKRSEAARYLYI